MNDDADLTDPAARDGARDKRLAAFLAVEPLDEVTRRRLVRTAVQAARPDRASRGRWAVAASVAAVMVGGVIAASVTLSDGGDPPTAARTPVVETTTAAQPDGDATSKTASTGESSSLPTTGLPDLGDVTDRTVLAQQVRAVSAEDRSAAAETVGPPCGDGLAAQGFRDVEVVGQGVHDGAAVLVFRATRDGAPVALVAEPTGSCDARSVVPLPA